MPWSSRRVVILTRPAGGAVPVSSRCPVIFAGRGPGESPGLAVDADEGKAG